MHPFVDPSNLTDEEILEKLKKCYNYLGMQSDLGHNDAVSSIQQVIAVYETEKDKRAYDALQEALNEDQPEAGSVVELGNVEEPDDDFYDNQW